MEISVAQNIVKEFAKRNNWKDEPNIDKFDHAEGAFEKVSKSITKRYEGQKE